MDAIVTGYVVSQTAWLYLSSMLIIAGFYRFRRVWSLRNCDLLLLLSVSPGILLVRHQDGHGLGYAWLFISTVLWTIRLLLDGLFTKRARLDPNLNPAGMTFLGICAFGFLMTEAVTRPAHPGSVNTVKKGEAILQQSQPTTPEKKVASPAETSESVEAGPTASLLAVPMVSTSRLFTEKTDPEESIERFGIVEETASRILAILAHIAIIAGFLSIGKHHFHGQTQGIAMATLYLLFPSTSYVVCEVNQVLPCAFILWAIACYNRPLIAGLLMGFACGSMLFPIFLLPIWASFFGWRRSMRFFLGVAIVGAVLVGVIALISPDSYAFTQQTINRIDLRILSFGGGQSEQGFWNTLHPAYRIPVMVAFFLLVITLTVWPWKKTLEVLISGIASVTVFTQFWYPELGGAYVLWYLPLLILVVFRPRLLAQSDYRSPGQQHVRRPEIATFSSQTNRTGGSPQPYYR